MSLLTYFTDANMAIRLLPIIILFCLATRPVYAYGPFDYTDPDDFRDKLPIVEEYHFNSDVENLRGGMGNNVYVSVELIYVLRSFPNHHRALNAMSRLWLQYREKGTIPPGTPPTSTPEHFFEEAIKFAPHDGVVQFLYAMHLHSSGEKKKAIERYRIAEELLPNSVELHYNMGLLYFDMKNYEQANTHAQIAYKLGYPLQGLKKKLIRVGAWNVGDQ